MLMPIVKDQYTAGQAYFLCVIGVLVFESCLQLPPYLIAFRMRGKRNESVAKVESLIYPITQAVPMSNGRQPTPNSTRLRMDC